MNENSRERFYENEDYIVRIRIIDGIEKYFIKFNMTDSQESEISLDIFTLYYTEFKKPFENRRKEHKRHIDNSNIDSFNISGKLLINTADDENTAVIKYDIDAVLKTCTLIQQRRFKLYYFENYTYEKIARLENCDYSSVKESINATLKKIKKYFFDTP